MATTRAQTTRLTVEPRSDHGSRTTRRLRREGKVPGVLYGRGGDPVPFAVDARELRIALQASGAVLEVELGGQTTAAVAHDLQHHPVRGEVLHIDLLRVDLDKPIQQTVPLELEGADEAPGNSEGGVLEHVTRELNVEALPAALPDVITVDVSGMALHDTLTLDAISAPEGVTILDDPETVVATMTLPRLEVETEDEVEAETEVVGEGEGEAFAAADSEAEAPSEGDTESGEPAAGEQPE